MTLDELLRKIVREAAHAGAKEALAGLAHAAPPEWMTRAETRLEKTTLKAAERGGQIRTSKRGRRKLFLAADVSRFIAAGVVQTDEGDELDALLRANGRAH